MKPNQLLIATFVVAQFAAVALADDATTNSTEAAEIQILKQEIQKLDQKVSDLENKLQTAQPSATVSENAQIQDLDQKIRILGRQRENDQDAAAAAAKTQPKITLGANGFGFSSADSNFVVSLHGLIQTDSRTFINDAGSTPGKNQILLRRARPILTGTVFHDFDFNFTPDFGNTTVQIFDAYLNYHYNQAFQVEAGKFKSPVGLEALQADAWTSFNERSIATDLVPNRDLGVELHGDLFGGAVSYAAGIFDGAPDYNGTTVNTNWDDDAAFEGRVFFQPWKTSGVNALQGLGFGLAGSYEADRTAADLTPGYKTDGQQTFFSYTGVTASGTHWRISPQGYYYYGPFNLLGEYVISDQIISTTAAPVASADLQNTAWDVSAGWVLTGEDATYNGITPRHPFSLQNGGWGAWQVVARYADLNVDSAAFPTFATAGSASEAKAWSVGLNWYLNRDIRINTSFSRTTFTAGGTAAPTAVTKQPENAIFTRIQLSF